MENQENATDKMKQAEGRYRIVCPLILSSFAAAIGSHCLLEMHFLWVLSCWLLIRRLRVDMLLTTLLVGFC
jgi:hypothetical protein